MGGQGAAAWFSAEKYGEEFQGALLYLSKLAMKEAEAGLGTYLQDFKTKALAWQQMAVKPALPEEARRHQVLAEYAYKNKDVAKAIMEYFAALNIYPYWPDGPRVFLYFSARERKKLWYRKQQECEKYTKLLPR